MARDDDDAFGLQPKIKPAHEIGQSLDALSVSDFDERIAVLKAEIERLEKAREAKAAATTAAAAIFSSVSKTS